MDFSLIDGHQEQHHAKQIFQDEYVEFLKNLKIEYADNYLYEVLL